MNFSIREVSKKDYKKICELFREADLLRHKNLPHVFRGADGPEETKKFISGIIANEDAALFVAERECEIIGAILVLLRETSGNSIMLPRQYAWIGDLVLREQFRRSGVGRSLVEKAHQWSLGKGVSQVQLNVWEFNKEAIIFFKMLGYKTIRRTMRCSLRNICDDFPIRRIKR